MHNSPQYYKARMGHEQRAPSESRDNFGGMDAERSAWGHEGGGEGCGAKVSMRAQGGSMQKRNERG